MTVPNVVATGGVRYLVYVEGSVVSEHTQFHTAVLKAQQAEEEDPTREVEVAIDQRWRVEGKGPGKPPKDLGRPLYRNYRVADRPDRVWRVSPHSQLIGTSVEEGVEGTFCRSLTPGVYHDLYGLFSVEDGVDGSGAIFEIVYPDGQVTEITVDV